MSWNIFNVLSRKSEEEIKKQEEHSSEMLKVAETDLIRLKTRSCSIVREFKRSHKSKLEFLEDSIEQVIGVNILNLSLDFIDEKKELIKIDMRELAFSASLRLASLRLKFKCMKNIIWNKHANSEAFPIFVNSENLEIEYDTLNINKIIFRLENLKIILDFIAILDISHIFEKYFSDYKFIDESMDSDSEKTEEHTTNLQRIIKEIMENGISSSYDFDINIKSWITLIPFNIQDNTEPILLFKLEHFVVNTTKSNADNLVFNNYNIDMKHIQINIENLPDQKTEILLPFSISSQFYVCKGWQLNKAGYRLKLAFSKIEIFISDIQINFLLKLAELISKKNRLLEKQSDTSNLSQSENSESFIARLEEIIKTTVHLQIQEISVNLINKSNIFCKFIMKNLNCKLKINKYLQLDAKILIENLDLFDFNIDSNWKNIISIPSIENSEVNFEDAQQDNSCISISICFKIKDKILNALIQMHNAKLVASVRLFECIESWKKKIFLPPQDISVTDQDFSKNLKKLNFSMRISFNLEDFEIILPVNKKTSWDSVTLRFDNNSVYESVSKINENQSFNIFHSKNTNFEEIANLNLQFSRLQIIAKNAKQKKCLIKPTRVTLDCDIKTISTNITFIKIEIRLEYICVKLGFRDLDFIYALVDIWSQKLFMNSLQIPEISKIERNLICITHSDSLKIAIQEDTIKNPYSILILKFNNLVCNTKIISDSKNSLISGTFSGSSYNKNLKSWEKMIENWKFICKLENSSEIQGFNLRLSSSFSLSIDITESIIENLGIFMRRFYENSNNWGKMYKRNILNHRHFDYAIVNKIGVDIVFWVDIKGSHQRILKNQEKVVLTYNEVENIYSNNFRFKNFIREKFHSIGIYVPDFSPISGIIIEDHSTQIFELTNNEYQTSFRKDIIIKDNIREISLSHNAFILNSTENPIYLYYNDELLILKKSFSIPIDWKFEQIYLQTLSGLHCILAQQFFEVLEKIYICIDFKSYTCEEFTSDQCFVINSPYIFKNYLPFTIEIFINSNKERILPGECWKYYSIELISAKCCIELLVHNLRYSTELFNLEMKNRKLFLNTKHHWSILLEVKQENLCTEIIVSCNNIFVNITEFDLKLTKSVIPKKSVAFVQTLKNTQTLVAIDNIKSSKSEQFNINTIGLSECIALPSCDKLYKSLLIGICICPSPIPNSNTKIIKFLPRFIVSNHLGFSIFIRQFNMNSTFRIVKAETNESIHYQLDDSNSNNFIQISEDEQQWSSPFFLNNVDNFLIKFKSKLTKLSSEKYSQWYLPTSSNNMFFYARVQISTENQASINIAIKIPEYPDFKIYNNTSQTIYILQVKCKTNYAELLPGMSIPWIFDSILVSKKKIIVKVLNIKQKYSLEKIKSTYKKVGEYNVKGYCHENSRILEIYDKQDKENFLMASNLNESIEKYSRKVSLSLRHVIITIFDEKINEKFLLFFGDVNFKHKLNQSWKADQRTTISKFNLIIGKFQIDNMNRVLNFFSVIAHRSNIDIDTPFLEVKYKREIIDTKNINLPKVQDVIDGFEVQIQPLSLCINHEVLLEFFDIQRKLVNKFYNIYSQPDSNSILLTEIEKLISTEYLFNQISDECNLSYFKFIRIHALDIILTFRKAKSSMILSNYSPFIRTLSNSFVDFARITQSPLSFKEIVIQNSYQNQYTLLWALIYNFSKQGLHQFYRILGASEILGNPIGLLDKLGTGVFEFFSEPAKGLLLNPKAFARGVRKGTKSLVSNVISGGLGTVANITGSLYHIVSDENIDNKSIFNGLGISDLEAGFKGVAYKPYQGFNDKGILGLASGITEGILGVSIAPIAAFLHFSYSITSKLADKAEQINENYRKIIRIRYPRYSNKKILNCYDHNLARFYQIIFKNSELQKYEIRYFIEMENEELLITDKKIIIIANLEIIKEIKIDAIFWKELHFYREKYVLFIKTDQRGYYFCSESRGKIYKLYFVLEQLEK